MKVIIFLAALHLCTAQMSEDETVIRLQTNLELINWDLEEYCSKLSSLERILFLSKSDEERKTEENEKINLLLKKSAYLKNEVENLLQFKDDVPYELERDYSIYTKCGDYLLNEDDYTKLIQFAHKNLQLENCENETCNLNKVYSLRSNVTELEAVWIKRQEALDNIRNVTEYIEILQLVNTAGLANDNSYNARSYWEMLLDLQDAYTKADFLWQELSPLYEKFHKFVLTRLNKHYNTNYTEIPVYLTGSQFGDDWSGLTDIVLPHPQIFHDINAQLNAEGIKTIYKFAYNYTKSLDLRLEARHFWKESIFDAETCSTQPLTYCYEKYSEILTCNKSNLNEYLNAHEITTKIALDELAQSFQTFRQSPLNDAIVSMGSTIAMNNLIFNNILEANIYEGDQGVNNRMTNLLLVALRILPKLAYYYSVDFWRLNELENPDDIDLVTKWWETRRKFQLVSGHANTEMDFFEDENILYNKPYINKFLGLIIQFQILSYYQINLFQDGSNAADAFSTSTYFKELLEELPKTSPLELLEKYYQIDDISEYPLKEFFAPLEEYFESAPLNQESYVDKIVEAKFSRKINQIETSTKNVTSNESNEKKSNEKIVPKDEQENKTKTVDNTEAHFGIYIGILLVAGTVLAIGWAIMKKKKKKKQASNNRRFET